MNHLSEILIIGIPILVVWLAIAFIDFNIWIRWRGRDTEISLSYGEFAVRNFGVPETHFDYKISASLYPNGQDPTVLEAMFGILPYPTLILNGPDRDHVFGAPIWNFALLWAGFLACSHFSKNQT